jgi:hypothetical protein
MKAGYCTCVTTEIGRAVAGDDSFCLKRLAINELDDYALFTAKLDGAYDWLARVQGLVKQVKLRVRGEHNNRGLPLANLYR